MKKLRKPPGFGFVESGKFARGTRSHESQSLTLSTLQDARAEKIYARLVEEAERIKQSASNLPSLRDQLETLFQILTVFLRHIYGPSEGASAAYTSPLSLQTTVLIEEEGERPRFVRQVDQPENRLPAEEKRAIENQPYGKKPRAAEMSDKLQDAIKKGEHPGAFIQRELIGPSEQTLEFIADKLGVHWCSLSYLKNGRYKLSPEMAAKLSHYFSQYTQLPKYSTQQLLTIQAAHDAKKADQDYLASLPQHKDPTPV